LGLIEAVPEGGSRPNCRAGCRQIDTISADSGQSRIQTSPHHPLQGNFPMAYNIVAERDNETVRMRRNSSIIAIAKARVWASEGWEVTIVDDDENPLAPAEDAQFLNA
jgi:hypothetical protein